MMPPTLVVELTAWKNISRKALLWHASTMHNVLVWVEEYNKMMTKQRYFTHG